jgi:heptaprenyl diphosphate synthase
MWDEFPTIKKDLQAILARIEANIDTADADVQAAVTDMFSNGGKLLRPAFTLLIGRFHNFNRERLLNLAATVEMLHTASLVHDDIIDDSPTRRHAETLQAKFGKDVAVYAGDYLFAITFRVLADYSPNLETMQMATNYLQRILNGELEQRTNHYKQTMTMSDYESQIGGKTASLFVLAAKLGVAASDGDSEFAERVSRFAYNVGMAFQILDDILDYQSTTDQLGKPALNDVREGVYTAPLIIAMQDNPTIHELLAKRENISGDEISSLAQLVRESGAVDKAIDLATEYTDGALDALDELPDHESKNILLAISQKLLVRQD